MRNDFELGGRRCHTYAVGDGGPVIFWGIMSGRDEFSSIVELIERDEDQLESFTLFAFETDSWFDDLSPWRFETADQKFGDKGKETLDWLVNVAVPNAEDEFPRCSEFAITGYSLAGLFSLWVFYETGIFKGVGCCSGSLWFGGWDKYADGSKTPDNGVVYLSLGGKEPGSGNMLTASIGTQYLKQKKRLEKDPRLRAHTYEKNSGGHFSDPVGRVMKSIKWLAEELSVY